MTDYDSSYLQFLRKTEPQLDLGNEQHCKALLKWLNDWGCRQFAINYHGQASEEIRKWFIDSGKQLISIDKTILDLTEDDFASVKSVYAELVNKTASLRDLRSGGQSEVEFGPTGTAKILFALRPNSYIPWDEPMRTKFQLDGSAGDYVKFLKKLGII